MDFLERPVLQRYVVVGLLNFAVFYALYMIFFIILGSKSHMPTLAWAIAWMLGSIFAHWTHRKWSFQSERVVSWTFSATMGVYFSGWIGSTATFDWLLFNTTLDHNLIWLVNTSIWGIIDYLGLRYVAFRDNSSLNKHSDGVSSTEAE